MKVVCVLALCLAVASATFVLSKDSKYSEEETKDLFGAFKSSFGKTYKSKREETRRYRIFKGYVEFVRAHNVREAQGLETYKTAINHLCDLTQAEYRKFYLGGSFNRTRPYQPEFLPVVGELTGSAGETVDWRTKNAVTPVKNQGQCGSCWSFSTTGSTEGAYAIATGSLRSLSEQQLMDCSVAEGDHSCEGGLMDYAFKYIIENKGVDSESDYPYLAKDESCDHSKESRVVATLTSYKDVPQKSETQLQAAAKQQPVSVAIEADQRGFQTYHSGVFSGLCGDKLDHGVLVVGYSTEGNGDPYWIVKNSWGASWGDQGYIQMIMGKDQCGIADSASYPTAPSGPAPPPPPPGPPGPSPPPPSPSGTDYEDPKPNGCSSGEQPVKINGVTGDYCAPSCASGACPASPSAAKAECVVETPGSGKPTLCALICTPGTATGDCPGTATCKAIQGTGICTYDD